MSDQLNLFPGLKVDQGITKPITRPNTQAQVNGLPLFGGSQEVDQDPRVPRTNQYKELLNQPLNEGS